MSEYLLFIHGVNTRDTRDRPDYANGLIQNIQRLAPPALDLQPVVLYWGDVNADAEQRVLQDFTASSVWDKLSFTNLRARQMLQFTGDAALYISRTGGRLVVDCLLGEALRSLKNFLPDRDHLHLCTHSMGTIILFDVLFSSRWDAANAGGYLGVEQLRQQIFQGGFPVRSIHTMGSPIGIFSLMMGNGLSVPETHDVTPRLRDYLQQLCATMHRPFPWRNYLHPMDPIATPIERLLPGMLKIGQDCLDVKDLLTQEMVLLSHLSDLTAQTLGAAGEKLEEAQLFLTGGSAHSSYWASPFVALTILQTIGMTLQSL